MKKRTPLAIIVTIAAILASLVSCGTADLPIGRLGERFSDLYGELPAGRLYTTEANEWEEGYLSPELSEALFGIDATEEVVGLRDFCVYLGGSRDSVAEFGIFICESRSDAEAVSELCLYRLSTLRSPTYGAADTSAVDTAFVQVSGGTVIYAAMPNAESARRAADALLD